MENYNGPRNLALPHFSCYENQLAKYLVENWLPEQAQSNEAILILELSTKSAEEPDFWYHHKALFDCPA